MYGDCKKPAQLFLPKREHTDPAKVNQEEADNLAHLGEKVVQMQS